jgi:hypothetical protein
VPAFGIRLGVTLPIGASLAVEIAGSHWAAIVYANRDGGSAYESVRSFGKGVEAERRAAGFVRDRNADLRRWLAARAVGAGGSDPGGAAG